jgi:hypothetical protein
VAAATWARDTATSAVAGVLSLAQPLRAATTAMPHSICHWVFIVIIIFLLKNWKVQLTL